METTDEEELLRESPEDTVLVQVLGLDGYFPFIRFHELIAPLVGVEGILPDFEVIMEENCVPNVQGDLMATVEFFIKATDQNMAHALADFGAIELVLPCNGKSSKIVNFAMPEYNLNSRAAYREVFELKKRLPLIEKEYTSIGADRNGFKKPTLPSCFQDKEWFMRDECFPAINRKRKMGETLTRDEFYVLKSVKIVDTKALLARIDALYNEESDVWLLLRKYHLAGLFFKFHE